MVQDHQPLLYGSDALHVMTLLRTEPGADVLEAVRGFKRATEGIDGVQWIYAGKVAVNAGRSAQLGDVDWTAAVVLQYPSREAYDAAAGTLRAALEPFAESYSQGFRRAVPPNLLLPQFLLTRRIGQLLSGAPSNFPFVRAESLEGRPEAELLAKMLLSESELGADAAVVVNIQKHGSAEQRAADAGYVGRMMGAMAEGGYGPMHMGTAVRVEAEHDFDAVVIVYYPGVQFFADMARSEFFQGIVGGKQLGDNLSSITVPILDRL